MVLLFNYLSLKKIGGCSPPPFPSSGHWYHWWMFRGAPQNSWKQMRSTKSSSVTRAFARSLALLAATSKDICFSNTKRRLSTRDYKSWLIHQNMLSAQATHRKRSGFELYFFFWHCKCENTSNLNISRTCTESTENSFLKTKQFST